MSEEATAMKSAKEECEALMNSAVPFADQMLRQHREFYPYGEAMAADGQEGARTGEYKATALVVDIRVVPPGKDAKQDAIAVRLDHRDGYSVVVVFPYSIGSEGEVTIEAPFAVNGEQRIFAG
jgi:hypothetical protein